jgi:hypothetical protein
MDKITSVKIAMQKIADDRFERLLRLYRGAVAIEKDSRMRGLDNEYMAASRTAARLLNEMRLIKGPRFSPDQTNDFEPHLEEAPRPYANVYQRPVPNYQKPLYPTSLDSSAYPPHPNYSTPNPQPRSPYFEQSTKPIPRETQRISQLRTINSEDGNFRNLFLREMMSPRVDLRLRYQDILYFIRREEGQLKVWTRGPFGVESFLIGFIFPNFKFVMKEGPLGHVFNTAKVFDRFFDKLAKGTIEPGSQLWYN